jgi:hypothetical protein
MILRAGYLRAFVLGLPVDEGRFAIRGFNSDSPARARLEQVGLSVISHYNLAVAEGFGDNLSEHLGFVSNELCGFAHEGAAMGLYAIDAVAPFSPGHFTRYIEGEGKHHLYMSFIGAGLAIGALSLSYEKALRRSRHFSRILIMDGYGFFRAFFRTEPTVRRQHIPAAVAANPIYRERYDAGVGRALWFVDGGDPDRLANTIAAFAPERRPQLWAGVGLACTYAGGVSREWICRLLELGAGHELMLAQGSLLACHARYRAGNPAPHNDLAAQTLTGLTAEALHRIADDQLDAIDQYAATTNGEDTWSAWLATIRHSLADSTAHAPVRLGRVGMSLGARVAG